MLRAWTVLATLLCLFATTEATRTAATTTATDAASRRPFDTRPRLRMHDQVTYSHKPERNLQTTGDELSEAAPELVRTAVELFIIGAVVLFGFKQYKKLTAETYGGGGGNFGYQQNPVYDQQPGFIDESPQQYYQGGATLPPPAPPRFD